MQRWRRTAGSNFQFVRCDIICLLLQVQAYTSYPLAAPQVVQSRNLPFVKHGWGLLLMNLVPFANR